MINIGDKIRNINGGTTHIVESIDRYDDVDLVFTKDVKYFPLDTVEKVPSSPFIEVCLNILTEKPISAGLENEIKEYFSGNIFKYHPTKREIKKSYRKYKLKLGYKETITQKIKFYFDYYFL